MKTIKVLVPEYFKNFDCIGSDCEDTCCKSWNISVDKKTYNRYKRFRNAEFSPLADDKIKLNPNKTNDYNYAYINLDESGHCPFLDKCQLCTIYQNMSASYMPNTCIVYPRSYNLVNTEREMSLSLSCPEAARVALLNPDYMSFEYVEMEYQEYMDGIENHISNNQAEKDYFWDIRIAAIRLLQNRNFAIPDRLVFIGMLYHKIQNCIATKNYTQIPEVADNFVNVIEKLSDTSILDGLEKNYTIQTALTKTLISFQENKRAQFLSTQTSNYIKNCKKLLFTEEEQIANNEASYLLMSKDIVKNYESIMQEKVIPFLDHGYSTIIENYLVNEYFRKLMPFDKSSSNILESLNYLCANYMFIKAFLAGLAYQGKELSTDDLISVIYLVSRDMGHSSQYNDLINYVLNHYNMEGLGGLYLMIFS